MKAIQAVLYVVLTYRKPGPKWHRESGPVQRPEAVRIVEACWARGQRTRLVTKAKANIKPQGIVLHPRTKELQLPEKYRKDV